MKETERLSNFENHFPENRISDLVLLHNGREQCTTEVPKAPCLMDHYLFNLIICGKGQLRIDDKTYFLHAGQGFLVRPGQVYHCFPNADDPWEYLWIGFLGQDVESMLFNSRLLHICPIYESADWMQLYQYMQNMVSSVRRGGTGSLAECQGLLLMILAHLQSQTFLFEEPHDLTRMSAIQKSYLQRTLLYIQDHLNSFFTVRDIAESLGLNRSYLSRLFTEMNGISLSRFIANYRLDHAWHTLRHTSLPIIQIAHDVGYRDPAYFSRRFMQRYRLSPTDVRSEGNRGI